MTRPTWDQTWLAVAQAMAERSRCETGVGCVIVDAQRRIVGTGYAGPPADYLLTESISNDQSCEVYCPQRALTRAGDHDPTYSRCPSVHAEINAFMFSDRSKVEGGTLYVSSSVCVTCMKAVGNSGVTRVVWPASAADDYRDPATVITYLRRCGIIVDVISLLDESTQKPEPAPVVLPENGIALRYTQECLHCRRVMNTGELAVAGAFNIFNAQPVWMHPWCAEWYVKHFGARDVIDDAWRIAGAQQNCVSCKYLILPGQKIYRQWNTINDDLHLQLICHPCWRRSRGATV